MPPFGDLRLERAFVHLLIIVLKALSELLQPLLAIDVPLQMPLICRALLPSMMLLARLLDLSLVMVRRIVPGDR